MHLNVISGISKQSSCGVVEDFDRCGNDYKRISYNTISMFTQSQCCDACDDDSACAAYTFVWPPAVASGCWLKYATPPKLQCNPVCEPYCVSGHKPFPEVKEKGYDRPGSDLSRMTNIDGAGACGQYCDLNEKCKSWTYVDPAYGQNSGCYIKNQVPGKTKISGCGDYCTSGVPEAYTPPKEYLHSELKSNRFGYDKQNPFITDGPDGCNVACTADMSCKSWTYVETYPYLGCYLKNSVPQVTYCDVCTSSGAPTRCSVKGECQDLPGFVPKADGGAWIIWRYIDLNTVHQAFAYDNSFIVGDYNQTYDINSINSGYYGCGYDPNQPDECQRCAESSLVGNAGSTKEFYCMGVVCSDSSTGYHVLQSTDGLGDAYPYQLSKTCWFLDPLKGESLNATMLRKAELSLSNSWNYCTSTSTNVNELQYILLSKNCRYYVNAVMDMYCSLMGKNALGCTC